MTKPTLMAQLVASEKRLQELQEENARLREDAERYRWLRNACDAWMIATISVSKYSPAPGWDTVVSADQLDAAIDAARKEQK